AFAGWKPALRFSHLQVSIRSVQDTSNSGKQDTKTFAKFQEIVHLEWERVIASDKIKAGKDLQTQRLKPRQRCNPLF
ncbi:MAG: hypothetical protein ONB43_22220, partial [candidate division KSB1 bacterium]|nr:hypothetical protein [candidate division KSB1 bacterium]